MMWLLQSHVPCCGEQGNYDEFILYGHLAQPIFPNVHQIMEQRKAVAFKYKKQESEKKKQTTNNKSNFAGVSTLT